MLGEKQDRWNRTCRKHWWPRGNHEIVRNITLKYIEEKGLRRKRYIDIGCSGGIISEYLSKYGETVGLDISFEGLKICKERLLRAVNASATRIPFKNEVFSMATLFEVAEHMTDDKELFKEIKRILHSKGLLLMSVPAHMYLWGSHDVFYGHRKRYTKRDMIRLAKDNNFRILKISYMHPCFLPGMALWRYIDRRNKKDYGKRDDFKNFGFLLDNLLFGMLVFESWILKYMNFPFGTSLLCVMEKI